MEIYGDEVEYGFNLHDEKLSNLDEIPHNSEIKHNSGVKLFGFYLIKPYDYVSAGWYKIKERKHFKLSFCLFHNFLLLHIPKLFFSCRYCRRAKRECLKCLILVVNKSARNYRNTRHGAKPGYALVCNSRHNLYHIGLCGF